MSARMEVFPAPTRGWIQNENKATYKSGGAERLDNWFPGSTGIELRAGSELYAKTPLGARVGMIIPYVAGANKKLFAADTTAIYDISTTNATDNDTYTKVLLHSDGTDTSTTFTDSNDGGSAHTWTAAGNAQIDTAASKFNGASALFDGTGDWVTTPDHADFNLGSGAFTVDFWFNCNAAGGTVERLCGQCDSTPTNASTSFRIQRTAANVIEAVVCVSTTAYTVTGTTTFTATGWHHVALVRTGNILRLFINGTQEGGDIAITGTVNDSSSVLAIGTEGAVTSDPWTGWIDEFRLSVGVARWTGNFTPPTAPYELLPVVSGMTNGEWQWVQFTTSGGTFLRLVNGADTPRVYDGSSWGTTPTITGATPTTLSHVWVFKNRLFFVQKDTLDSWYLPVDSVGGAATKFPLGGVFKLGGSLVFGGSWSVEAGDGLAEKCVFVTTEGEVAIYEGTDPASATTWALQGVYRIGRPLGPRAVVKAGGDLVIATDVGMVPLSQVLTTDLGALGTRAITHQIETEWTKEAAQRVGLYSWHCEMWPTKQRLIVAMPSYSSLPLVCFVANIRTGAWCRYTGWDTHSLGLYQGRLFFGTNAGLVVEAEVGGNDQGAAYTGIYIGLFSHLKSHGLQKIATLGRATYITTQDIGDRVSACADFVCEVPVAPSAAAAAGGANTWNNAIWNQSLWSSGVTEKVIKEWVAVSATGEVIAPVVQVTVGQDAVPVIKLIETDLQFKVGVSPG
jgi:hypothetical protein